MYVEFPQTLTISLVSPFDHSRHHLDLPRLEFISFHFTLLTCRFVYPMNAERTLLSCPGRVQDWLGAAADQIETLLQVPLPSLSGSDQAIGALRIKSENPSWAACPYNLRRTNVASDAAFPVGHQISLSVSSDRLLCADRSPSRCENCVAEKGSRCSRDLPSCTRCRKNGMSCLYMEGQPTGRRKPQGRTYERSSVRDEGLGLLADASSVAPLSEDAALLEANRPQVAQYPCPETSSLCAFEYTRPSLEHPIISPIGFPRNVSSVEKLMDPSCQTLTAKRQITSTSNFSILPHRMSRLEAALEVAEAEFSDAITNGLKSSSV